MNAKLGMWMRADGAGPFALDQDYGAVPIGTTATLILKPDPMRTSIILFKTGSVTGVIGFDSGVTLANGYEMTAGYTPLYMNDDVLPGAAGRAIWAIASASGGSITYLSSKIVGV